MTSRRQPEFIAMAADQVGIFHIQDLEQQAEKEISSRIKVCCSPLSDRDQNGKAPLSKRIVETTTMEGPASIVSPSPTLGDVLDLHAESIP